jgi:hypothetical protein
MDLKVKSENPLDEIIREMLTSGMLGMIEEVDNNRVLSPEWKLYKSIIISSMHCLEMKFENEHKSEIEP